MHARFQFHSPKSIAEALRFLSERGDRTKIVAGGTDLIPRLREGNFRPEFVVNILEIEELQGIREVQGGSTPRGDDDSHPDSGIRDLAEKLSFSRAGSGLGGGAPYPEPGNDWGKSRQRLARRGSCSGPFGPKCGSGDQEMEGEPGRLP